MGHEEQRSEPSKTGEGGVTCHVWGQGKCSYFFGITPPNVQPSLHPSVIPGSPKALKEGGQAGLPIGPGQAMGAELRVPSSWRRALVDLPGVGVKVIRMAAIFKGSGATLVPHLHVLGPRQLSQPC